MIDDFFEGAWFLRFYLGFFATVLVFGAGFFVWAWRGGHLKDTERVRSMPLLIDEQGEQGEQGGEERDGTGGRRHGEGPGGPRHEAGGPDAPGGAGGAIGPVDQTGPFEISGQGGRG